MKDKIQKLKEERQEILNHYDILLTPKDEEFYYTELRRIHREIKLLINN